MKCVHQMSSKGVVQEVFGTQQNQYPLRIYSPYPQIKIVIFSKMSAKIGFLTLPEIENLANLVVKEFGLNPNSVVWIEHDFSQSEELSAAAFNLITFDINHRVLTNPRWLPIQENWFIYWLESANIDYITI